MKYASSNAFRTALECRLLALVAGAVSRSPSPVGKSRTARYVDYPIDPYLCSTAKSPWEGMFVVRSTPTAGHVSSCFAVGTAGATFRGDVSALSFLWPRQPRHPC